MEEVVHECEHDVEEEDLPVDGEGENIPEDDEADESQLMQQSKTMQENGRHLGILSAEKAKEFLEEFKAHYLRPTGHSSDREGNKECHPPRYEEQTAWHPQVLQDAGITTWGTEADGDAWSAAQVVENLLDEGPQCCKTGRKDLYCPG